MVCVTILRTHAYFVYFLRRRSLRQDCPQAPYRRRQNEEKTVVNWSDRSLFLTELEFLIRFDKKTTEDLVIVVAGTDSSQDVVEL